MLGTSHAKSVGTWRKPERLLGTNYDDAVNMLEKYSESAGKCDNNPQEMVQKGSEKSRRRVKLLEENIENAASQRKWCKKETGNNLGKID